jgi:hypothetical protein
MASSAEVSVFCVHLHKCSVNYCDLFICAILLHVNGISFNWNKLFCRLQGSSKLMISQEGSV